MNQGWPRAWLWGIGIVLYFAVASVWLPSWVLRLGVIAEAESFVQDVVGVGVWLAALLAGVKGLRHAQRSGWTR